MQGGCAPQAASPTHAAQGGQTSVVKLLVDRRFDRDLTVAGRVLVREGEAMAHRLVRLPGRPRRLGCSS